MCCSILAKYDCLCFEHARDFFSIATNEGFLHDAFLDHFSIPEDKPIGHLIVENSILGCQTSTNNPVAVELRGTRKRSEIATKMGLTSCSKKEQCEFINL